MISSIEQLKDLILWAREQRLKTLKVGDVALEFSELAFVGDYSQVELDGDKNPTTEVTLPDDPEDDDEILFHSAR